jgi:aspartate carbamoyltransferase catalytic subunit
MPHQQGLLDLKNISQDKVLHLFQWADKLKKQKYNRGMSGNSAILLFLEPSTRTRVSFEVACQREGILPVVIQGKAATSLEKEETIEDTFLNLAAMDPMAIIIRASDEFNLTSVTQSIGVPLINAGWGVQGHPTQALLDTWTLFQRWGSLQGKKILILGDIVHSRVAQSHFELAQVLGYEVRVFAPPSFLPKTKVQNFTSLKDGLEWCDAVMALRTQKERHQSAFSAENFNSEWGLNSENIKWLKKDSWIMHPGPVNWGIELTSDIKSHPQSIILDQVRSGVYIRQALLHLCQEGTW